MVAKPAAASVPAQPITIAEVKPPGQIENMEVGDYVPSAEDLARLAKNSASAAPEPVHSPPAAAAPERATIIPPSIAKRTMEELEAGRKLIERKEEERRKRTGG